uniref:Uncharacterized protein n=1 Tax=Parascaris univalens TaxID=6257 RepID=A0A915ABX2_PARUN
GGKRERCPQTQKLCCWPIPTRDCHTGQPGRKCNNQASPWRFRLHDHESLPARLTRVAVPSWDWPTA